MTISELRVRSNNFVANLNGHIKDVVSLNEKLEQLNKDHLLKSKLSNDASISPAYRKSYSNWKRFNYPGSFGDGKPNMFLTGDMFDNMELVSDGVNYEIESLVSYSANLIDKYSDKIFGVAPSNQDKAYAITTPLLAQKYNTLVL